MDRSSTSTSSSSSMRAYRRSVLTIGSLVALSKAAGSSVLSHANASLAAIATDDRVRSRSNGEGAVRERSNQVQDEQRNSLESDSSNALLPPPAPISRWKSFADKIIKVQAPHLIREELGEERVVAFPQWAVFTSSGGIEVTCSGYVYQDRDLATAPRSQRLVYNLAKRVAGLPPLPYQRDGTQTSAQLDRADVRNEELLDDDLENEVASLDLEGHNILAKLVQVGDRVAEAERDDRLSPDDQCVQSSEDAESVADVGHSHRQQPIQSTNHSSDTATESALIPALSTVSPFSSTRELLSDVSVPLQPIQRTTIDSSLQSSPAESEGTHPAHNAWPLPFAYTSYDLPRLHGNLDRRLSPFFASKLAARRIRLSVYPLLDRQHCLNPLLAQQIVISQIGGGYGSTLRISEELLRQFMVEEGIAEDELEKLRIKVVVDLLPPLSEGETEIESVAQDFVELDVATDGGVRVISDIDDTIKHTEVLASGRTIFRNVFVRDLDEIRIPGMVDWYRSMQLQHASSFHYVSNSPFELYRSVVQPFLSNAGFPSGSITLKQYSGSSMNFLSKLWEDPGSRKKASIVNILEAFPKSRFILIGDSGEQDLTLYVSLAQTYSSQIAAIYIRDVTTPFSPTSPHRSDSLPPHADHTTLAESIGRKEPKPTIFDIPGSFDSNDGREGLSDSGQPAAGLLPPRRAATLDPVLLRDPTTDPLSPNNPTASMSTSENAEVLSEARIALIEQFYAKLVHAEEVLKEHGTMLRIFRHGGECVKEAVELVRSKRE